MPARRFKLIYLSHDLTKKVEWTLTHRKVRAALLGLAVCFLATNVIAGLVASFLLNSRENEALQLENQRLKTHVSQLQMQMAGISQDLAALSETDRMLRIMADLPAISEDVRKVGVGGSPLEAPMDAGLPEIAHTAWTLDQIEREIRLQQASFEEIHQKLTANAELLDHTPTLRPVEGGYISSGFGARRDPFTKKMEHHPGVDICQERGTPVVAAAEGDVSFAKHYYSYGKFVVVEHGYGFQTAYGHLSQIMVKPGQHVSKGQLIGLVGSTGRATGSHLHYEVRVNGRPVDPTDYYFEDVASFPAVAERQ